MEKKETTREFLARKKERDGRLSKLGEWMLGNDTPLIDLSAMTTAQRRRFWRMALR